MISLQERIAQKAIEAIKSESDFEIERVYGKAKFGLHSGRAGCDWEDGTKEGDYIVHYDFCIFKGDFSGCSGPLSKKEFTKHFSDIDSGIKWVDGFLKRRNIVGYETLENTTEQLTFF